MKVFVTGATGRIGSRFVPVLLARGHNVRVLVRDKAQAAELEKLGAEAVIGDLRKPASLPKALKGMDVVAHLAAYFRVRDDDEGIFAINTTGTIALAKAAEAAHVSRFMFVSTGLVYAADNKRPARPEDKRENLTVYPASKIAAEDALFDMHKAGRLDVRVLRLGFVYGDKDPHVSEVLPLMQAWGWHPAQRLHLVHHYDVTQALMLLLQIDGLDGEAYNVADDAPLTGLEVASLAGNEDIFAQHKGGALEKPWEGLLDITKLRQHTGFRPIVPSYYIAQDLGIL